MTTGQPAAGAVGVIAIDGKSGGFAMRNISRSVPSDNATPAGFTSDTPESGTVL